MTRLLALLSLTVLCGCTDPITEIVLEYRSDLDLETIDIVLTRGADVERESVQITDHPLPFTQVVVHRGGALGPITVQATGRRAGREVVATTFGTQFVPDRTMNLVVDLTAACRNVICQSSEQCVDGMCQSTLVVDAGRDAGAAMDAGPVDAGGTDASPMDASATDTSTPLDAPPADTGCRMVERNVVGDYQCDAGCSCTVQCESGEDCEVSCAAGATCTVYCQSNSNCRLLGGADTTLSLECEQSTSCQLWAGNGATADLDCDRSSCNANCVRAESCEVRYSHPNSLGFLRCDSANRMCDIAECRRDEEDCGGGTTTCNRSCP